MEILSLKNHIKIYKSFRKLNIKVNKLKFMSSKLKAFGKSMLYFMRGGGKSLKKIPTKHSVDNA